MNIALTNVYSPYNSGDSAIVESILQQLRKNNRDIKVGLYSDFPIENKEAYSDISSYHNLWALPPIKNKLLKFSYMIVSIIYSLFIISIYRLFRVNIAIINRESFQYFFNSNLIIACGGGYLFSSSTSSISLGFFRHLYIIYVGLFLKKKVVLAPQTIGPINKKLDVFFLKYVLKNVDFIALRDNESMEYLKTLGISSNAMAYVPDVVFSLENEKCNMDFLYKRKYIAITVLDWRWATSLANKDELYKLYIENVTEICSYIISEYKLDIVIVPQVVVDNAYSDFLPSKIIFDTLKSKPNPDSVYLYNEDIKPCSLMLIYKKAEILIGSRMHSTIYALNQSTPVIALSYQAKIVNMFNELKMNEYCFDAYNIEVDILKKQVKKVLNDTEAEKEYIEQKIQHFNVKIDTFFKERCL